MSPENSFCRKRFVVPQPLRLFRNQIGHFFGEEEICAFHSSYAARAWESAVEPIGPVHTEEHVFQSPNHAGWPFPLMEVLAYCDEEFVPMEAAYSFTWDFLSGVSTSGRK